MSSFSRNARPNPSVTSTNAIRSLILICALLAFSSARSEWRDVESASAAPAAAVDVIADELEIHFAEGMTFSLVARSTRPIERVVLRFSVDDPDIVDRRIPVLENGNEVIALHEETLARGQIPPTAEITWWWSLHDDQGTVIETERITERYLDESLEWRTVDDRNVRVWFEGDAEAEDAALETVSSALEAIDWLSNVTGKRPEKMIEIVTFEEQEDLRRALAARGDVYETRLRTLGARVAPSVVVLDVGGGGRDLAAVIFHELSHVVLGLHMDQPWADLPAWLDEGFAMYAEGELGGQELSELEEALRQDDLMSVRSLSSFPGDAERVTQAYGQSRDFVAFLIEEHDPGLFRELLDAIALGDVSVDEALSNVYGYDRLSMYQAYRAARGLEPAVVPTDESQRSDLDADASDSSQTAGDSGAIDPVNVPGREIAGGVLIGVGGLAFLFLVVFVVTARSRGRRSISDPTLMRETMLSETVATNEGEPANEPLEDDMAGTDD